MYAILIALEALLQLMMAWMTISLAFQIIVSLFGFKRQTKDYEPHDPQMRFLVLIPAHNEAGVISGIIENMHHMDYPKELFDVYVLADNCTDDTAELARCLGASVLEFHNASGNEPTGKSIALQKAFRALPGYEKKYDAVFFFDADNLVDHAMFREVNSQFLSADDQTEIIQCYLGCKNNRGLVAYFYYLTYTISNRFLQYSRYRLHLNCGIGGTGFVVTTRYLYQRGGWTVRSLTEDTELQLAATLDGRRVLWNNHVRVYDEKPTRLGASLRQRVRWAQGHWFVAFRNTVPTIRALRAKRISVKEFISMFVQMYFPSTYLLAVINTLLIAGMNLLLEGPFREMPNSENMIVSMEPTWFGVGLFLYTLVLQFLWGDWADNRQKWTFLRLPWMLLCFVVNTVVAGLAQFIGLFKYKEQNNWDKTEHTLLHGDDQVCPLDEEADSLDEREGRMKVNRAL